MTDKIIGYAEDGKAVYDNAPTVVAVAIVAQYPEVLVIQRATNPGKGKYALPGGFHMRGETWQEAGAREVYEEVGLVIDPSRLELINMETDSDGHNVIIARYELDDQEDIDLHLDSIKINLDEVQDFDWLCSADNLEFYTGSGVQNEDNWAFPLHYQGAMNALYK